ncbi:MAG: DUF2232 domain-containing protein [Synechococcales cyanobacterium CRU_2_2]|nr:DUF2232 domain-containing protein [Synechococcales cyanobacterium CRU_2_2]
MAQIPPPSSARNDSDDPQRDAGEDPSLDFSLRAAEQGSEADWNDWVDGGADEREAASAKADNGRAATTSVLGDSGFTNPVLANSVLANSALANSALANPALVNPALVNPALVNPAILADTASGRLPESPLPLVETAFLASTTSLLWLINSYFPLGPIWRICFPIPIALVYLRWNRRAAWMTTAVSVLLLTVFTGPARSLFFLMPSGLLGMLLGFCWRRGAGWGMSIFLGTLINTIGFFFRVALTSVLLNEDLWIYVTTQVTKLLAWVSVRLGLLFQPDLTLVQLLALVLVLINSVIYLLAVHLAAWFLLKRMGIKVPDPPEWIQVLLELDVED